MNIISKILKFFMENEEIIVESTPEVVVEETPKAECSNCTAEVTDCSVCQKGAVVE